MTGVTSLLAAALMIAATGEAEKVPEIGRTLIPFYSGNLSVSLFMDHHGVPPHPVPQPCDVPDHLVATLKRTSVVSMCDYPSWAVVERERGVWDWSYYRANQQKLKANGIGYHFACWIHFPPKWYLDSDRMVPYRNLVTGHTIPQISLWSPDWPRLWEEWYRRLAQEFYDDVDFVRVFYPTEYGEPGYCMGMTHWLNPQPYAEPGYWCGDSHALTDYQSWAMTKYGTLDAMNAAWGTEWKDRWGILMPDPSLGGEHWRASPQNRRRWIDFIDWYNDAWDRCARTLIPIVRKHFPNKQLVCNLGYGQEPAQAGNDEGRYTKTFAEFDVSCQTPGNIGYFATRRCSSAARFYDTRYYTEPPGNVPRERIPQRIWMDASNGTQAYFDYPQNLDGARDIYARYKHLLDGEQPVCFVALWMPTYQLWLHPDQGWPKETLELANRLREYTDFEVVDDLMIRDGVLDSRPLNARIMTPKTLILAQADFLDRKAWEIVLDWVEEGGTFIYAGEAAPVTIEGATDLWVRMVPQADDIVRQRKLGRGSVIMIPGESAELIAKVLWKPLDGGAPGVPNYDGNADGLWCTAFRDRLLYFNFTEQPVTTTIEYHLDAFPSPMGSPESLSFDLHLEPKEIEVIPLENEESAHE